MNLILNMTKAKKFILAVITISLASLGLTSLAQATDPIAKGTVQPGEIVEFTILCGGGSEGN